ncbi:DUF402 domain-containing protein [Mycoplasma sp. CH-Wi4]|uniref:DUF402 domain-containing protein n=2 Tax=Mycoplasma tauri TaxID=547987 RepID=A0A953NCX7_9MOLU|nr:DUF402 domain-containing protein [Mycoplasma tauri]MBZ4195169.1 DUF402 domain-containing protein [Mycoplasma tauri]MBZ4203368.1 DUF402 domain-containing protein [Mycoplasma tauri]MBZ4204225.1 DUF402 domain-containing protein [Mycoplasma tauri]MBZ4212714.1 DUF402 domain-containing protein [Mycoplasma tauri]MBZ4218018.1 DUF402 domain-containing protein [Mycoplasma tauri]
MINVQAYKYDGSLYRQWNGIKVLRNTPKHYVLVMYKSKVSENSGHNWICHDYVIWFLPKHSMYNALILLKPAKRSNYAYINISSTPIYEDNTIKFIDFELDVKAYPDTPVSVVDMDEFKENSKIFRYPKTLKEMIWNGTNEVLERYKQKEYFFSPEVIDYYIDLAKRDKTIAANFRVKKSKK